MRYDFYNEVDVHLDAQDSPTLIRDCTILRNTHIDLFILISRDFQFTLSS